MAIERFYTSGFKIIRATVGTDAYGGAVKIWPVAGAYHLDVSGKLWALRGDQRTSADKETLFADYKFTTGIADIVEGDRLEDAGGNQYEIRFAPPRTKPDSSGHMEVECELIR